ncbi:Decaprenyl diphosphate synthase-like protein [Mycena albidolilacea]|uniref:Alkyl transferase n=1 Tax=Mycena albidolilacea TaxID=1033008 RepID=A0AAD7A3X4_9AGAR|nr:Decaprenyl diphosphate synthase-like protein [Mycena albidolilacea]
MLGRALRWIRAKVVQKAERLLLRILAAGPIPKHVAFVMDGNRRYARSHQQPINQGHSEGFVALRRMLEACMRLEIRCVSAYAFAMDNFKRSPEEIEHLMDLAHDKLMEMSRHGQILEEYGVRLNVLGKTALLPERVQEVIRHVESITRNNNKAILNICIAYSSQDEITTAVNSAVRLSLDKEKSNPDNREITEHDIDAQLFTSLAGSPPLDILVRTSGVKRLSDFLLWQSSENTQIHFSKAYWPEFGLWDFVPIILDYQRKAWSQRVL